MEQKNATMQLPMDLIKPAIEAHVNAAVIEALKGHEILFEKLVQEICSRKVSDKGTVSEYAIYNTTPWITWAVRAIVEKAVRDGVIAYVSEKKDVIQNAVEAEMKKSGSKLVRAAASTMLDELTGMFTKDYGLHITFKDKA